MLEFLAKLPVGGGLFAIEDPRFGQGIGADANGANATYFRIDLPQPLAQMTYFIQFRPFDRLAGQLG